MRFCRERSSWARLRRWENQRMLYKSFHMNIFLLADRRNGSAEAYIPRVMCTYVCNVDALWPHFVVKATNDNVYYVLDGSGRAVVGEARGAMPCKYFRGAVFH